MRFELKTDHNNILNTPNWLLFFSAFVFLIILLSDLSLNIKRISRNYEIDYLCRLVLVDKSSSNFKRLSKLTRQESKSKVWEYCKSIIN